MLRRFPSSPCSMLFVPLIYVAWADGDLDADELDAVAGKLEPLPDTHAELAPWLDAANPPTAVELAELLERMRTASSSLSQKERHSLRSLGRGLAERAGHSVSPSEVAALESLEDAIGVAGDTRAASILWPVRPPSKAVLEAAPSFDVGALTAALFEPRAALRRDVLAFIGGLDPQVDPSRPQYRAEIHHQLEQIAKQGWGNLPYPESVGGGGDLEGFLAVFETLGFGDLSLLVKYGVQFGLYGLAISMLGTDRHHREFLPDAASLATAGCFAMTETGHGSNVGDIETTAIYDPSRDELVINTPAPSARKDYIGNAANYAELAVVFAQLTVGQQEHGVHAVVVPLRDKAGRILPGRLIEECGAKLGLDGVDNGRISFNSVRVPRAALLDRFAQISEDGQYESDIASPGRRFFTMLGTLVGGRIAVASASVSAAKLSLTIALRYAHRRRQFGPKGEPEVALIDYPQHRRRLLPRLARIFALHAATRRLGARFCELGGSDPQLESDVAAIKALATWSGSQTIAECREACGGRGYLTESRFAQLKADTEVFTTFEGDNTVLLQLVAKTLLSDYARGMRELSVLGLARHVARRALAVFDRDVSSNSRTDREHLRDTDFQSELFASRQDDLLHSLAKRMKKRIDSGLDSFTALRECQTHALALGHARAERLAIDELIEFEKAHPALAAPLERLRSLAALSFIESSAAWFLENGYLAPSKARAIRDEVDLLCEELGPLSLELVSAFGLSDDVIRAPIGLA